MTSVVLISDASSNLWIFMHGSLYMFENVQCKTPSIMPGNWVIFSNLDLWKLVICDRYGSQLKPLLRTELYMHCWHKSCGVSSPLMMCFVSLMIGGSTQRVYENLNFQCRKVCTFLQGLVGNILFEEPRKITAKSAQMKISFSFLVLASRFLRWSKFSSFWKWLFVAPF